MRTGDSPEARPARYHLDPPCDRQLIFVAQDEPDDNCRWRFRQVGGEAEWREEPVCVRVCVRTCDVCVRVCVCVCVWCVCMCACVCVCVCVWCVCASVRDTCRGVYVG